MINSFTVSPILTKLRCRISSIEITRYHALMAVLMGNMMYFGWVIAYGWVVDAKLWYDELFTVGNALRPLPDMLGLVLGDNHPPLFAVFMHFWMQIVPKDEFAARLPSMIFAIGSVCAIWQLRKTALPPVMVMIATVLLTSHHLWSFYALEARGYALLLFLATMAVVLYIRQKPMPLIVVGAIMGLVHFFGALFASLFFALLFFTPKQSLRIRVAAAIAQVIVSIYPFYHLFLGAASEQMGGNFWMSAGPSGTFTTGLTTAFPWFGLSIPAIMFAFDIRSISSTGYLAEEATFASTVSIGVAALLTLLFLVKGYLLFRANYACIDRDMRMRLLVVGALALAAIGIIALISLHTPMGESRNFIVLVPIGCLLGAWFVYTFFIGSRINAAIGVVALSLMSGVLANVTYVGFSARAEANSDYDRWSVALYDQVVSTTGKLYYLPNVVRHLASHLSTGEEAMFKYYMPGNIDFIQIPQERILDLPRGSTVAFWFSHCTVMDTDDINSSINTVRAFLNANGRDHTFYAVESASHCATGYVVLN